MNDAGQAAWLHSFVARGASALRGQNMLARRGAIDWVGTHAAGQLQIQSPSDLLAILMPSLREMVQQEAAKAATAAARRASEEARASVWTAGIVGGLLGAVLGYFAARRGRF